MRSFLFLAFCLLLISFSSNAQQWKWAIRGGGSAPAPGNSTVTENDDKILSMATDSHGNVYALAQINTSSGCDLNGTTITTMNAYNAGMDILLMSYDCSGNLRWKKHFGGSVYDDKPLSVNVDRQGDVYVTGFCYNDVVNTRFWDTDTTVPVSVNKSFFVARYDTSGNFGWLRMPEPDTLAALSQWKTHAYDATTDDDGNLYILARLEPGQLSQGNWVVTNTGGYIMKYNPQGSLVQLIATPLSWSTQGSYLTLHLAHMKSGKFLLSGFLFNYPVTINGQPYANSCFLICLDAQGQLLWKKESNSTSGGMGLFGLALDSMQNIYAVGSSSDSIVFNGQAPVNTFDPPTSFAMVMKMDSTGNPLWLTHAYTETGGSNSGLGIACSGGQVIIHGEWAHQLYWDQDHQLLAPFNTTLIDLFLARLDAQTGTVLALDSLKGGNGENEVPTALAADTHGNAYFAGQFPGSLYVPGNTLQTTGYNDFFIAKNGYACNCVVPAAAFTKTVNTGAKTATFTYTGTTASVDSVRWSFGDGQQTTRTGSSITSALTHTYDTLGNYTACVTVFGGCGTAQSCQAVAFPIQAVFQIPGLEKVKVYPNPAVSYVEIDGAEGATVALYDLQGRMVSRMKIGSGWQRMDLSFLVPGAYRLLLLSREGTSGSTTIIKH